MAEVLFKKVDYSLKKLIEDIDIGEIGLPDIQRPFVWPASKVRDLFDSMYRGYPIGYLLFWENGFSDDHRTIGVDGKQKVPLLLIVDGQQRLTSLYAVIKGVPIIGKDFRKNYIRIAFKPSEEKFEVTNPAIEKDAEWIPDISEIWKPTTSSFSFVKNFLQRLKSKRDVLEVEEDKIAQAIGRLEKLMDYPLTALEVSSSVDEDQVAEIFVRINSKGTPLNQADFILTLMSVFWDEGRAELEDFCRRSKSPPTDGGPSPFNHYLRPNPDQLLRVSVALGFRRARLEHVYSLLRGKDLQTKQFSSEQRDRQFEVLRQAQAYALNLLHWHDFFKVIKCAGYPSDKVISSQTAILYTYALWLIGKRDFKVHDHELRKLMARWFFMASLTGRYTDSPETRMEQDMALLAGLSTPEGFIETLDQQINVVLTNDFWDVTLPNQLETASPISTGQFAYFAALCLLDAKALYSNMKVSQLLDPTVNPKKEALERHHLFPRDYLKSIGITDKRLVNQVANYTLLEWKDNIDISNMSPREYVPKMEQRFPENELKEMYKWHALPDRWYEMDFKQFLEERRKRMAQVIRKGYMKLLS
ncbi:GmrSD restriction endonuclease domain-containing protein [Candidatus Solincola sp.]